MSENILDACCLINLYATDMFREILRGIGGSWRVVAPALAEATFLRDVSDTGEEQLRQIDLSAAVSEGVLFIVDATTATELETFVELAAQLDDAEALGLAIAKHHGWRLATDDRKACSIARSMDVGVVTTPELMKAWAKAVGVGPTQIRAALSKITLHARFTPGPSFPEFKWWQKYA